MSAAERVRATRERVHLNHGPLCYGDEPLRCECDEERNLDAYAAAVRAETLASVRSVDVDDALILAVEDHVGMGCGAWDMVKASEIIRGAVLATLSKLEAP